MADDRTIIGWVVKRTEDIERSPVYADDFDFDIEVDDPNDDDLELAFDGMRPECTLIHEYEIDFERII